MKRAHPRHLVSSEVGLFETSVKLGFDNSFACAEPVGFGVQLLASLTLNAEYQTDFKANRVQPDKTWRKAILRDLSP